MQGRKPKPIARQLAEGDPLRRGKRKLREQLAAEPKATRGLPDCPRHLRGRERAAWKFWRTELKAIKMDFRPDAMMLEGACVNYARAVRADLMIAKEGPTIDQPIFDRKGKQIGVRVKNHPALAISAAAWRQMHGFCSEFGFSPIARTRLAIEGDDGEGDLLSILSQPRQRKIPIQ